MNFFTTAPHPTIALEAIVLLCILDLIWGHYVVQACLTLAFFLPGLLKAWVRWPHDSWDIFNTPKIRRSFSRQKAVVCRCLVQPSTLTSRRPTARDSLFAENKASGDILSINLWSHAPDRPFSITALPCMPPTGLPLPPSCYALGRPSFTTALHRTRASSCCSSEYCLSGSHLVHLWASHSLGFPDIHRLLCSHFW